MAGETRVAFMDETGAVIECSMCVPGTEAEWAALRGYSQWEDMDRPDGKAKYVEPGDAFTKATGDVVKGAKKAEVEAFLEARAIADASEAKP